MFMFAGLNTCVLGCDLVVVYFSLFCGFDVCLLYCAYLLVAGVDIV